MSPARQPKPKLSPQQLEQLVWNDIDKVAKALWKLIATASLDLHDYKDDPPSDDKTQNERFRTFVHNAHTIQNHVNNIGQLLTRVAFPDTHPWYPEFQNLTDTSHILIIKITDTLQAVENERVARQLQLVHDNGGQDYTTTMERDQEHHLRAITHAINMERQAKEAAAHHVQIARANNISWERIAEAAQMARQSAISRWSAPEKHRVKQRQAAMRAAARQANAFETATARRSEEAIGAPLGHIALESDVEQPNDAHSPVDDITFSPERPRKTDSSPEEDIPTEPDV